MCVCTHARELLLLAQGLGVNLRCTCSSTKHMYWVNPDILTLMEFDQGCPSLLRSLRSPLYIGPSMLVIIYYLFPP